MTRLAERCCGSCTYWHSAGPDEGECHRFPPHIIPAGKKDYTTAWPITDGIEWCGEYAFMGEPTLDITPEP